MIDIQCCVGNSRKGRKECEQGWCVDVKDIIANNYILDIKNPFTVEGGHGDPDELLKEYKKLLAEITDTQIQLKDELANALASTTGSYAKVAKLKDKKAS